MNDIYQSKEAMFARCESVYGNQVIFDNADADLVFSMAFADTKAATNTFNQTKFKGDKSGMESRKMSEDSNDKSIEECPEKKHHFMVKLMEKCGHTCIEFVSSNWQMVNERNEKNDNGKIDGNSKNNVVGPIYRRKLTIKTSPQSRFSLFPKRNSQFEILQTKMELKTDKATNDIVIYNECTKRDCDSKMSCEYSILEKWLITTLTDKSKSNVNNNENPYFNSKCQVKFECSIILDDEIKSDNLKENLGLIRTKVLRYCMQNFNEWRLLIKDEFLINFHKMYLFLGNWNKLNSYFQIKIIDNPNQIIYNDGSTFDVTIIDNNEKNNNNNNNNNNSVTIRAGYADGFFDAKIVENTNNNVLKWNNGSVWIRNGFKRFDGFYKKIDKSRKTFSASSLKGNNNNNNINYNSKDVIEIDSLGYIFFENNKHKDEARFVLTSENSLMYIWKNHKMEGSGKFNDNGKIEEIEWKNGYVWKRIDHEDNNMAQLQQPPQQPQAQGEISDDVFDEILSQIPKSESSSPAKSIVENKHENEDDNEKRDESGGNGLTTDTGKEKEKGNECVNEEKESSSVDFEDNIIHVNGFNDHYFNVTHFEFDCECCKSKTSSVVIDTNDKNTSEAGNENDNNNNVNNVNSCSSSSASSENEDNEDENDDIEYTEDEFENNQTKNENENESNDKNIDIKITDSTQQDCQDWLLVDL